MSLKFLIEFWTITIKYLLEFMLKLRGDFSIFNFPLKILF